MEYREPLNVIMSQTLSISTYMFLQFILSTLTLMVLTKAIKICW